MLVGVGAPAAVGLFLILRRPRTLVAWILLAGALSVAVVMAAFVVAERLLRDDPGSALGGWALLLAQEWLMLFAWPLALAYCFPDGRLLSPRWKPLAALALGSCGGAMLLLLGQPTLEGPDGDVPNPLGIDVETPVLVTLFWACWIGVLISLVGGALALRARYRAGGPAERRQVLWLAYGAVLPPLWLGANSLLGSDADLLVLMTVHAWLAVAVAVAGDAPRPVLDRPPVQPDARLRAGDGPARGHLRDRGADRRPTGGRHGALRLARHPGRRARVPAPARPRPWARSCSSRAPPCRRLRPRPPASRRPRRCASSRSRSRSRTRPWTEP